MKRLLSIIMLIVCVLAKADAQYYSVNYDRQTVAAMAAAYGRELLLPPYLQHGVGQNHAEDMDGGRNDAEKSADSPLLGKLSCEDM